MYTVIPGRTGALAVRLETVATPVRKPAPKPVASKSVRLRVSERKVIMHAPCLCSSKGGPISREFRSEKDHSNSRYHKHSQLKPHLLQRRRSRRAVIIFY